MPSAHWSLETLTGNSATLAPKVRAQLLSFCADAPRHAKFLNTLSLMEHIGSRKIMASQSPTDPDHDTLKHLAEEARHAFFFKRAAENMINAKLSYADANTFAGPSARSYMGRLDAAIAKGLGPNAAPQLPYLYMSLIVELRAIWFYRLYQEALQDSGSRMSLKSVLAEEELHLSEMLDHIGSLDDAMDARLKDFVAFEARRFEVLWSAIVHAANENVQPTPAELEASPLAEANL